jgi:Fe-S cluster assembly ATPase SufC
MLIIALSEGAIPIIVDQPEDSLDIRAIWEDMCRKIRRGKERRQFIFTTHNSSLAVASDAGKFIVMEADATHGQVLFSGSMDHSLVSDQVMKYLERGIETSRTKYGKHQVDRRS